ncbi:hypothetical protein [Asticcacaulis sp. AND118]|uniref:hypothetical protein n=1 Tax=Asticcacaulis sp. AND118 TaxID=2840468 RepID=UPI001CFFD392|nr:hypothetical protein [Asticcacaulis sp. AND118]UDF05075.1 hypothetical protein LH365_16930 [Asticcacaulis sp. AND118]
MLKQLLALTALIPLAGCVSAQFQEDRAAAWTEYQTTIPVCETATECRDMWEMAEVWVVKNASYKIQTKTDVQISTYNSADSGIQANILKEPLGNGRYRIVAHITCGAIANELCSAHPAFLSTDFNRTLNAMKAKKPAGTSL